MSMYSRSQLFNTPATHGYSLMSALDSTWSTFTEAVVGTGWRALHPIARAKILDVLGKIKVGKITVLTKEKTYNFGVLDADLRATLDVKSDAFWVRVGLFTDMGLAEAFMFGDVDCEDVSSLIQILIANRRELTAVDTLLVAKGRTLTSSKFIESLTNSRANISAHYDFGNTMFSAFLSEDMNYSSAVFLDYNEDLDPTVSVCESLEEAQMRKLRLILKKGNIQPGQRVLEIGTGWGSLAILAAKTFNCTVDTITLSSNQAELARQRIADAKLSDQIKVHCMDFRECRKNPEWAGSFDRFISVEMIEHVGKDFFEGYWAVADWALNPETGVGVVQGITIPESRVRGYDENGADFVQKWSWSFNTLRGLLTNPTLVFPGGYLPSFSLIVKTLNQGSGGRLVMDSVLNIGPHYARTLREWKRRFLANCDGVVAKVLREEYDLDEQGLEVFRRKWIFVVV
ncbi:Mycolic acid cyclopropane synthetase-domain-containing protein [Roridomyces roridus]|uniref:Mycolic acid cyclopropane synthetase-domain-containing protein n=1 Tax=Roridomyces roridus TaxID=1738132 RepID=A0AAD7BBP3_9AGAR|nr:Mycolic acid cyclopropane synthetase-domain-containing protein [Roridomyces roridus]